MQLLSIRSMGSKSAMCGGCGNGEEEDWPEWGGGGKGE